MTKYLGVFVLIASMLLTKHLQTKISNSKLILEDFIKSESEKANDLIYYLRRTSNGSKEVDAKWKSAVQLYEEIKSDDLYLENHRSELLDNMSNPRSHHLKLDNISLFNEMCHTLINKTKIPQQVGNHELIVEQIQWKNNDSLNIRITPITHGEKDYHIEYYYQDEILNRDQLDDFKGDVSEVSALLESRVTGETHTVNIK